MSSVQENGGGKMPPPEPPVQDVSSAGPSSEKKEAPKSLDDERSRNSLPIIPMQIFGIAPSPSQKVPAAIAANQSSKTITIVPAKPIVTIEKMPETMPNKISETMQIQSIKTKLSSLMTTTISSDTISSDTISSNTTISNENSGVGKRKPPKTRTKESKPAIEVIDLEQEENKNKVATKKRGRPPRADQPPAKPFPCLNRSFCYICGEFIPALSRLAIYNTTKKAYRLYFGFEMKNLNEWWTPDYQCKRCYVDLLAWMKHNKSTRQRMKFAIPMKWSRPRNHEDDCYFCAVGPVYSLRSLVIKGYPNNIRSARLPIPHSADLPVPVAPPYTVGEDGPARNYRTEIDLLNTSNRERDKGLEEKKVRQSAHFEVITPPVKEIDTAPQRFTLDELNQLFIDLELTYQHRELLRSRLYDKNLIENQLRTRSAARGKRKCYAEIESLPLPYNATHARVDAKTVKNDLSTTTTTTTATSDTTSDAATTTTIVAVDDNHENNAENNQEEEEEEEMTSEEEEYDDNDDDGDKDFVPDPKQISKYEFIRSQRPEKPCKRHIIASSLTCPIDDCAEICASTAELDYHLLDRHQVNKYRCFALSCSQSFARIRDLSSHQLQAHSADGDAAWVCGRCGSKAGAPGKLHHHIYLHHQIGDYRCTFKECNFTANNTTPLTVYKHQKEAHLSKFYRCEYAGCKAAYSYESRLDRHVKLHHTMERPFPCDQCDQAFVDKESLVIHQRKHTGEKPFVCKICGKGFTAKSYLVQHVHTHPENRRFRCDECDRTFGHRAQLRLHLAVHRAGRQYPCDRCGKTFPSVRSRSLHVAKCSENNGDSSGCAANNDLITATGSKSRSRSKKTSKLASTDKSSSSSSLGNIIETRIVPDFSFADESHYQQPAPPQPPPQSQNAPQPLNQQFVSSFIDAQATPSMFAFIQPQVSQQAQQQQQSQQNVTFQFASLQQQQQQMHQPHMQLHHQPQQQVVSVGSQQSYLSQQEALNMSAFHHFLQ